MERICVEQNDLSTAGLDLFDELRQQQRIRTMEFKIGIAETTVKLDGQAEFDASPNEPAQKYWIVHAHRRTSGHSTEPSVGRRQDLRGRRWFRVEVEPITIGNDALETHRIRCTLAQIRLEADDELSRTYPRAHVVFGRRFKTHDFRNWFSTTFHHFGHTEDVPVASKKRRVTSAAPSSRRRAIYVSASASGSRSISGEQ